MDEEALERSRHVMDEEARPRKKPPAWAPPVRTPFTFTFICHLGKTHNHRSRGDTPWKAQTFRSAHHRGKHSQSGAAAFRMSGPWLRFGGL